MKKKFTEEQIAFALKQAEHGIGGAVIWIFSIHFGYLGYVIGIHFLRKKQTSSIMSIEPQLSVNYLFQLLMIA
ncbi:MAG TPA: hypothetical protein VLZ07_01105 [Syntrophales bacterium]|nr:hypothetical protein [Syntrophales bacterium]